MAIFYAERISIQQPIEVKVIREVSTGRYCVESIDGKQADVWEHTLHDESYGKELKRALTALKKIRYVCFPYDYKSRFYAWRVYDQINRKYYDCPDAIYQPIAAMNLCDKLNYNLDSFHDGLWSSGD